MCAGNKLQKKFNCTEKKCFSNEENDMDDEYFMRLDQPFDENRVTLDPCKCLPKNFTKINQSF